MRGLLVSSKSLPLFVLLIFSISSVGRLWVCSCFEAVSLLGSRWSFLWSSIRVRVHLVGICSLVPVLRLCLWLLWSLKSSFVYLKKEQATFSGWWSGLPRWLLGEHLMIMTLKPVARVPRCHILIQNFYHGWYIVATPNPGVVYYLRAWHRYDGEQSR